MLRNRRTWALLGLIATFVVVMFLPVSFSRTLRRNTTEALAPVHKLFGSISEKFTSAGHAVIDRNAILEENAALKLENAELERRVKDLEAIEKENLHLAQQLKFVQRQPRRLRPAKVIARDIGGWWRVVTIDRGHTDDVQVDQAVVTARGLVGKIIETSDHTAKVLLISDPSCKASVRLASEDAPGVLSGGGVWLRGKVRCHLTLIDEDVEIERDDMLITTGMGGVFPAGIDVGFVDAVELDKSSGLFQRATVVPAVDLQSLSTVFVITSQSSVSGSGGTP